MCGDSAEQLQHQITSITWDTIDAGQARGSHGAGGSRSTVLAWRTRNPRRSRHAGRAHTWGTCSARPKHEAASKHFAVRSHMIIKAKPQACKYRLQAGGVTLHLVNLGFQGCRSGRLCPVFQARQVFLPCREFRQPLEARGCRESQVCRGPRCLECLHRKE